MVLDPDVSSVIYRVGERMGQKSPKQIEICQKEGGKVSPAKGGERNRQIDTSRSKREKETQR
jgi:hypothetical protein